MLDRVAPGAASGEPQASSPNVLTRATSTHPATLSLPTMSWPWTGTLAMPRPRDAARFRRGAPPTRGLERLEKRLVPRQDDTGRHQSRV